MDYCEIYQNLRAVEIDLQRRLEFTNDQMENLQKMYERETGRRWVPGGRIIKEAKRDDNE